MIPFYIYYSMFGFQRVGDFMWAAGDLRARGFLLGATAGRTTLAGEGLQHQDGHSQVTMSLIPNCVSYDPCYSYELAVIVQDGLRRMYQDDESVYYYLTVMNENYVHPAMPANAAPGIIKGLYELEVVSPAKPSELVINLIGAGTILREVREAATILANDYGVKSTVFSATSFSELRREALTVERHNRLHPESPPQTAYVAELLKGYQGPFVAATDYVKALPDMIREWVPNRYVVLGTDGFGRSDARAALRRHFEVDRGHVVVASLKSLADDGKIAQSVVSEAMRRFEIDSQKPDPAKV
jgi:pyruvate dehydrogenase E1 component